MPMAPKLMDVECHFSTTCQCCTPLCKDNAPTSAHVSLCDVPMAHQEIDCICTLSSWLTILHLIYMLLCTARRGSARWSRLHWIIMTFTMTTWSMHARCGAFHEVLIVTSITIGPLAAWMQLSASVDVASCIGSRISQAWVSLASG